MHGREGDECKRRRLRYMRSAPESGTAAAPPAPGSVAAPLALQSQSLSTRENLQDSDSPPPNDAFLKDGRKIQVGDCALFQSGNAPPFIGLIRWFTTSKEDGLKICVNWLYRPADVKLAKGILLEAAPNEVFYSFHKDVIPAASLLHPCKVTFLQKGVELPTGISSFVCRRVYDIANKSLWWLTDQDYINERQEEVDKLLDRTRQEMHAAVQSGGHSPKQLNGPTNAQQLKSGSESAQNSGSSFPSQSKGKKRERTNDQGAESIKRERSAKPEDDDYVGSKLDNMIKVELAKITEKGGLVSNEGVEKLVNLMQLDRTDKKMDVTGRVMVAEVIAATDRYDCLSRFVQLRGLIIFDDWLQEAHKGKSGDGSSPKECDKVTEELLLALLRALDKLPVNLNALRTCNIGKSVNHLRSQKNVDIQKKARTLVDTWKKRVDAEMAKISDSKSIESNQPASWPVKSGFSDVSLVGNRRPGSSEVAAKNPVFQSSACKALPAKTAHSEAVVKSTPIAPGSIKSASLSPGPVAVSSKDRKTGVNSGGIEIPTIAVKEEKSSSSSQSQNNSQSCSSDHTKPIGSSWKEDARSSTAISLSATKAGGSSRHRRSSNGLLGTSISGIQKDGSLGRPGSHNRAIPSEKASQSSLTCEKPIDIPAADHGNSHRLIVRLPNPGRSPARTATGGSLEESSVMGSRASSPAVPDKYEHSDNRMKAKTEACRSLINGDANAESWQSNDVKEGLVGAEEGMRSPTATLDEEHSRSAEDIGKGIDAPRNACSSSVHEKGFTSNEPRSRNSFSSINALIESCVKYSEASAPLAAGDDIGMNLLASVAAGEISKSDVVSPSGSPGTSPPLDDLSTGNNDAKSRFSCDDDVAQSRAESDEAADADSKMLGKSVGPLLVKDETQQEGANALDKTTIGLQDNKLIGEQVGQSPISAMNSQRVADSCIKSERKHDEHRVDGCSSASKSLEVKEDGDGDGTSPLKEKGINGGQVLDNDRDCKSRERSSALDDNKTIDCAREKTEGQSCTSEVVCSKMGEGYDLDIASSGKKLEKVVIEESQSSVAGKVVFGALTSTNNHQSQLKQVVERCGNDAVALVEHDVLHSKTADESMTHKSSNLGFSIKGKNEPSTLSEPGRSAIDSLGTSAAIGDSKTNENHEGCAPLPASQEPSSNFVVQETECDAKPNSSKSFGVDADSREEFASSTGASSLAVKCELDIGAKLDFDLNEGILGDEGNQGEPPTSSSTCPSAIHLSGLSPFANSISSGLPVPISVAPAKGPFLRPENLLKSKGEPGWRGSAATSAFRPAEPRKVLEMPPCASDMAPSDAAGKQGRHPLDIDLNVADERIFEDMASQSSAHTMGSESGTIGNRDASSRPVGGLDLDLNRVDEGAENVQFLASTSHRLEVPLLPVRPASGLSNGEANILRDFDLNNGPGVDEVCSEPLSRRHQIKGTSNSPFLPQVASLRMNNAEFESISSWFPPGNSYSAVAIPSFLHERGEQPYPIVAATGTRRILGSVTGGGTFGADMYRGPVLSSSPAMAFSPVTSFPYAGFPFGPSFPLASTSFSGGHTTYIDSASGAGSCFPAIPSQLVGPASAVTSHYPRPYVISLPEGSTSIGSDNSRKWSRQGLDLNAGPGIIDMEGKDERLPSTSRPLLVPNSQAFMDEHARTYGMPAGGLKRKEPEGGWDADRSSYKQLSWQ